MSNSAKVKRILGKIEKRADEGQARMVYVGRALGRSEKHLQLSVSSGVVLVPIDEIELLQEIAPGFRDDLFQVTVRRADLVRHILRREQTRDGGAPAADGVDPDHPADSGLNYYLHVKDHGTKTNGNIVDACDATDVYLPSGHIIS